MVTPAYQPGDVLAERYRVLRPIGKGGYGAVYEAERLDGARVALKIMHERLGSSPVAYQRFEQEAALVQRLKHPNVVAVFDYGQIEELPYIAFELLHGITLRTEIETRGSLGVVRTCEVARQILSALGSAHTAGIVHRDVKPANVFLCRGAPAPDGTLVKMLDFGIAKAFGVQQREGPPLTATGQMIGTPQYMSPEQVRGSKQIDGRADLYAVGTLMAEMISGNKLVVANTDIEVFMAHIADEPHDLPARVRDSIVGHIITRAIAKKAEERYPTATAMLADLDAALPPDPSAARFAQPGPPQPTWTPALPVAETSQYPPPPPAALAVAPQMASQPSMGGYPSMPMPAHPMMQPLAPQPHHRPSMPAVPAKKSNTALIVVAALAGATFLAVGAGVAAWSVSRNAVFGDSSDDDGGGAIISAKKLRKQLKRAGFTITDESFTDAGAIQFRMYQFRRGNLAGSVQLHTTHSSDIAKKTLEQITQTEHVVAKRKGRHILIVVFPNGAQELLEEILD